MDFNWR